MNPKYFVNDEVSVIATGKTFVVSCVRPPRHFAKDYVINKKTVHIEMNDPSYAYQLENSAGEFFWFWEHEIFK